MVAHCIVGAGSLSAMHHRLVVAFVEARGMTLIESVVHGCLLQHVILALSLHLQLLLQAFPFQFLRFFLQRRLHLDLGAGTPQIIRYILVLKNRLGPRRRVLDPVAHSAGRLLLLLLFQNSYILHR